MFGDIHGQYPELMRLFAAYGAPSRLGDIGLLDYLVGTAEGQLPICPRSVG